MPATSVTICSLLAKHWACSVLAPRRLKLLLLIHSCTYKSKRSLYSEARLYWWLECRPCRFLQARIRLTTCRWLPLALISWRFAFEGCSLAKQTQVAAHHLPFRSVCVKGSQSIRCLFIPLLPLESWFWFNGSNECRAVPIFEEMLKLPSNLVLLLNCFWHSLLILQCSFEVVLRSDLLSVIVNQLQSEVPHHPEKWWEEICWILLLLVLRFWGNADVLWEVDDQTDIVEGCLVNVPLRIIDEERR